MTTPGALTRTTDAATEPVSRDEAKVHLRVTATDEHDLIDALIVAARQQAEEFTGRAFITQTWKLELDAWPDSGVIELPRSPISSLSSVKYYNTSGTLTTLVDGTDYQTDITSEPARITTEPDKTWPSLETGRLNAIEIIFVAGYGAATAVPQSIKQAILLTIGAWYEHREELTDLPLRKLPLGARALLWQKRLLSA